MKYGIKASRLKNDFQPPIRQPEYLLAINEDDTTSVYEINNFLSVDFPQPLYILPSNVNYDIRNDIYLTINHVTKTIDISRDCHTWSQWKRVPEELLNKEVYCSYLTTRMQVFLEKATGLLHFYQAPVKVKTIKLNLPTDDLLGIQLLDYQLATLYKEPIRPLVFTRNPLALNLPSFSSTNLNWLPKVFQYDDLPNGGKYGDTCLVEAEDQYYTLIDKTNAWFYRWWEVGHFSYNLPLQKKPFKTLDAPTVELNQLPIGNLAARYNGRTTALLRPRYSGLSYTFYITSNSDIRVTFNNQDMVDKLSSSPLTVNGINQEDVRVYRFTVDNLTDSVLYPFVLDFFQVKGSQVLKVEWESHLQPREVIPGKFIENPISPTWIKLDLTYVTHLDKNEQSLIRPIDRMELALFYEGQTFLMRLTDRIRVESFPRLKYIDFVLPEPFSNETIRKEQIFHYEEGLTAFSQVGASKTNGQFLELVEQATPVTTGGGVEILYHKDTLIYYPLPLYLGLWSRGIKALLPIDYESNRPILDNPKSAHSYLLTTELRHVEVITQQGVRLARRQDEHCYSAEQIWREAIPAETQSIITAHYFDDVYVETGENKNIKPYHE